MQNGTEGKEGKNMFLQAGACPLKRARGTWCLILCEAWQGKIAASGGTGFFFLFTGLAKMSSGSVLRPLWGFPPPCVAHGRRGMLRASESLSCRGIRLPVCSRTGGRQSSGWRQNAPLKRWRICPGRSCCLQLFPKTCPPPVDEPNANKNGFFLT